MSADDRVNILLVDDQPAKLLSYEAILRELDENLLTANSAQEAFEHLLKTDVAVVLVDVCMPELDGFQLARMVREHPRFQRTAIIFVSAVMMNDLDFLRGYECGAVDYVSVPVVPEILRAKVKVFSELYRKTKQLEALNRQLEQRVAERTQELASSSDALRRSEERLRLAFEAAQMGWWSYDIEADQVAWSPSLTGIMGFTPESFGAKLQGVLAHVHPDDRERFLAMVQPDTASEATQNVELRFIRPDGSIRWSLVAGHVIRDERQRPVRFAGVDLDITARKQAEDRQNVMVRELDHRGKNLLAVVQSILHLSRAGTIEEFIAAVDGRIRALSRTHSLLSESRWQGVDLRRIVEEEIAPFVTERGRQVDARGPAVSLPPPTAQSLALALHELVINAVKHGALSTPEGRVRLSWAVDAEALRFSWAEDGGPPASPPARQGFGTKVIMAGIERQLQGQVAFDWPPEGLRCTIAVPMAHVDPARGGRASAEPELQAGETPARPSAQTTRRILLVEDEPLIAIMMKEALRELGIEVLGPIGTVAAALSAAEREPLDGAVLDVNLGGDPIYPVADLLTARGISFVFVTGYSADAIDRRFAHVPVLEKPIEPEMLQEVFAEAVMDGRTELGHPDAGASAAAPVVALRS